jgi:hypothetical protein
MPTGARGPLAAILLCAFVAAPARASDPLVGAWSYDAELTPGTLWLTLRNTGPTALCLPRVSANENLRLFQRKTEIYSLNSGNRAILWWRDADLIAGMLVVPPGKSIGLFYNLRDWPLVSGPTEAKLDVRVIDCLSYFKLAHPKFASRQFSYRFVPDLPMAEPPAVAPGD